MLTIGTLFSGGEGVGLGAQQAGLLHLWGIEREPDVAAVAEANGFPAIVADVSDVDPGTLERVDVLHASPPCLDASGANGKRVESEAGKRLGTIVAHFIEVLQPTVFTLENVYYYRRFAAFRRIVGKLHDLGYFTHWANLNAADFAVPQTRRRLILRAVRGGLLPMLPAPEPWVGWYEAIEDLIPTLPESEFAPWQLARLEPTLKEIADYGYDKETVASKVLRILQSRIGEEALQDWGTRILEGFQPKEILRQVLYVQRLRAGIPESSSNCRQHALLFEEICFGWGLRDMRSAWRDRCSPQERELVRQFARQFATHLSGLSYEDTQSTDDMLNRGLQRTTQGKRILQQTLSSFQEVWRSVILENQDRETQEETDCNPSSARCQKENKDLGYTNQLSFPQATNEPAMTVRKALLNTRAFLADGQNARQRGDITTRKAEEPAFTTTDGNKGFPRAFLVGSQYGQPSDIADRRVQTRAEKEPSFTVTASDKGDKRAWLSVGRVVSLTPRALARLQTFPDSYLLPADRALGCKVIGNAFPPTWYRKLIVAFAELLEADRRSKTP